MDWMGQTRTEGMKRPHRIWQRLWHLALRISTSLKLRRQNSIHLRMTVEREGLPVTIIMHCYLLCRELYLGRPGILRKRDIAMSEQ